MYLKGLIVLQRKVLPREDKKTRLFESCLFIFSKYKVWGTSKNKDAQTKRYCSFRCIFSLHLSAAKEGFVPTARMCVLCEGRLKDTALFCFSLQKRDFYQQQRFKLFYCYAICYLFLPLVLSFLIVYNISEGSIAQLVERLPYKQDVIGSIPVGSKETKRSNKILFTFLTFLFT